MRCEPRLVATSKLMMLVSLALNALAHIVRQTVILAHARRNINPIPPLLGTAPQRAAKLAAGAGEHRSAGALRARRRQSHGG